MGFACERVYEIRSIFVTQSQTTILILMFQTRRHLLGRCKELLIKLKGTNDNRFVPKATEQAPRYPYLRISYPNSHLQNGHKKVLSLTLDHPDEGQEKTIS